MEHLLGFDPLLPDPGFGPEVDYELGGFSLTFEQPANRAALIETSTNLVDWMRWDEPENLLTFPATNQVRTIDGSLDGVRRFFRVQFWES